jgi:hypothetical protein
MSAVSAHNREVVDTKFVELHDKLAEARDQLEDIVDKLHRADAPSKLILNIREDAESELAVLKHKLESVTARRRRLLRLIDAELP